MDLYFGRASIVNNLPPEGRKGWYASPAETLGLFLTEPRIDELLSKAGDQFTVTVNANPDLRTEHELEIETKLALNAGQSARTIATSPIRLFLNDVWDVVFPREDKNPIRAMRNQFRKDEFMDAFVEALRDNMDGLARAEELDTRMRDFGKKYDIMKFSLHWLASQSFQRNLKIRSQHLELGNALLKLFSDPKVSAAFDHNQANKCYEMTTSHADRKVLLNFYTQLHGRRDRNPYSRIHKQFTISFDELLKNPEQVKKTLIQAHEKFDQAIQNLVSA